MRYLLVLLAAASLLSGCHRTRPDAPWVTYHCADGRMVLAGYPDTGHARLVIDGTGHRLAIARSASGARYTGDDWQWWTKGMHEAWLAPLQSGETIAPAPGVACEAQGGQ